MTNLDYLRRVGEKSWPWLVALTPKDASQLVNDIDAMHKELEYLRGERAAVVAWLRKVAADHETELKAPMHAEGMAWLRGGCAAIYDALDIIERGEHHREEEK